MKLFELVKNCNTKALCRILNDGIVLEDGKLLFLKKEENVQKTYFLGDVFLSMNQQDLSFSGEEREVMPLLDKKKTRILPFSKQSLLFQYTNYYPEPVFYFWVDEDTIGSCTLTDIRSFYLEPIHQFVYSNLQQLKDHFEGDNTTLVVGGTPSLAFIAELFSSFSCLDGKLSFAPPILYFKDKDAVWIDERTFIDFDWLSLQNLGLFDDKKNTNFLFPSICRIEVMDYEEAMPYFVFRFFGQEIQFEEILLLQKKEKSKYVLYSKGFTFSKEDILSHQKVKCLKR